MGNYINKIRQTDPDELFAYSTFKVVTILDRRLGLIHYALMLGIFAYIVLYNIIYQQGYTAKEVPTGSVRTTLKKPTAFTPPELLPSYCNTTEHPSNMNCYYGDQYDVLYPPVEADAMFITTRVSKYLFSTPSECISSQLIPECAERNLTSSNSFYYVNIEDFTVLIEHTVRGEKVDLTKTNTQMKGKLVDNKGHLVQSFDNTSRIADIVTVGNLLKAAGVTLDDLSESPISKGELLRKSGMVLLIFIEYGNEITDTKTIFYKYIVRYISGAEFKGEQPLEQPDGNLIVNNRHGIRIVFVQSGTIGVFDFVTLLLNLVSAMVLIKISTTFVDTVALRILPQRELYNRYKYEKTLDFSDIREGKVLVDERETLLK